MRLKKQTKRGCCRRPNCRLSLDIGGNFDEKLDYGLARYINLNELGLSLDNVVPGHGSLEKSEEDTSCAICARKPRINE